MPPRESVAVFRDAPARGDAGPPPLPAARFRTNTRELAPARPVDPMRCAPHSARTRRLQLVSTFGTRQRTYGLLGARLSFEFSRTRTEIAAYGTNLTDKYHIVGAVDLTAAGLGYVVNLIGPPRMYGIELTHQF
jgi:hypothetical protein